MQYIFITFGALKTGNLRVAVLGSGTSQGVPVIACPCEVCHSPDPRDKRLRSAVMVETNGQVIVVDTGPDFRQQMLRERVTRLDAILFTHQHKDHTAGLDDVRAFNFIRKQPANIYAEQRVIESLKYEFAYVFKEAPYPGIPKLNITAIDTSAFYIGPTRIIPIRGYHHKLPVLGFRMGDFVYLSDVNYIPETEHQKIQGAQIMILDALRHQEHISHFNVKQATAFAQRMQVPHTYFTHISHGLGFHALEDKKLPEGIHLAADGMRFEL